MTNRIRLATASPGTRATTAATLDQLRGVAARAAAEGADVLLLPEAYLGGYPRGADFGCRVGARTAAGRDEYLRYFRAAVDLGDTVGAGGGGAGREWVGRGLAVRDDGDGDGDGGEDGEGTGDTGGTRGKGKREGRRGDGTREVLEGIARDTGVFVVTGLVERAGGSLYCAVVYVCPKRGVIGKRRKVLPTGSERLIWAQGSPATLKAVSTTIRGVRINLAAAICWENYMPLLRQSLYAQNVNLYLAPTADNRDAWLALMRTVALEGRCFVVSSNMCVPAAGDRPGGAEGKASAGGGASDGVIANGGGSAHDASGAAATGRRRRSSCLTEEGFEIALPTTTTTTAKSLASPASPGKTKRTTAAAPAAVGGGLGSSSSSNGRRRRSSVIDEDGNEIVLPNPAPTTAKVPTLSKASSTAVVEEEDETRDGLVSPLLITNPNPFATQNQNQNQNQSKTSPHPPPAGKEEKKKEGKSFVSRGGSCIVSPAGDVLAGPQWEDDWGIIYADVDFDDCVRGRLDLDAAGSYSRNDSFKFSVEGLDLDPLPYW